MIISATIGVLVMGGVYLLLQRNMVRAVFGMTLISHAANFTLLTMGVPGWRAEPLTDVSSRAEMADPLPQAFVLTAIVISMAVTVFMLALAVIGRDDDMGTHPETGATRDAEEHDDDMPADIGHEASPRDAAEHEAEGRDA